MALYVLSFCEAVLRNYAKGKKGNQTRLSQRKLATVLRSCWESKPLVDFHRDHDIELAPGLVEFLGDEGLLGEGCEGDKVGPPAERGKVSETAAMAYLRHLTRAYRHPTLLPSGVDLDWLEEADARLRTVRGPRTRKYLGKLMAKLCRMNIFEPAGRGCWVLTDSGRDEWIRLRDEERAEEQIKAMLTAGTKTDQDVFDCPRAEALRERLKDLGRQYGRSAEAGTRTETAGPGDAASLAPCPTTSSPGGRGLVAAGCLLSGEKVRGCPPVFTDAPFGCSSAPGQPVTWPCCRDGPSGPAVISRSPARNQGQTRPRKRGHESGTCPADHLLTMTRLKERLCLSARLARHMARGLDAVEYQDNPFSPNRPTPLYDLADAVAWLERHCDEYGRCLAWKWNRGLALRQSPETDTGMAFVAKVLDLPAGHGSPLPVRPAAKRRPRFQPLGILPVPVPVAG